MKTEMNKRKTYKKPEVEIVMFKYSDVMASSGEPVTEAGVGAEDTEIPDSAPVSFANFALPSVTSEPVDTGETVWNGN